MELIFNPCGEFRWSPEGPVSQIHSPHLLADAPGIFSDLLRSVQMLKRQWDAESNGKLPHLFILSKTSTLVPEFAESAHSPTFPSLHLRHRSFSNPSVYLPTSQLILQPFRWFIYVTAHSPTLLSLLLRHRLFTYVIWRGANDHFGTLCTII